MGFEEFKQEVIKGLKDHFGRTCKVDCMEALKNNGVIKEGVQILKNGSDVRLAPVVYFDELYDQYGGDVKRSIDGVIRIAEQSQEYGELREFADDLSSWDMVKDRVYPALLNTDENMELLHTLVHEPFLDLSIVFLIRGSAVNGGFLCVKVTHKLLKSWGIRKKELRDRAFRNMRNEGCSFMDMEEILFKAFSWKMDREKEDDPAAGKMMVLSNRENYYGAIYMADADTLAEKLGSFNCYILPASIHEGATRFAA